MRPPLNLWYFIMSVIPALSNVSPGPCVLLTHQTQERWVKMRGGVELPATLPGETNLFPSSEAGSQVGDARFNPVDPPYPMHSCSRPQIILILPAQGLMSERDLLSKWIDFLWKSKVPSLCPQTLASLSSFRALDLAPDLSAGWSCGREHFKEKWHSSPLLTFLCPGKGAPDTKTSGAYKENVWRNTAGNSRAGAWDLGPNLQPASCVALHRSYNLSVPLLSSPKWRSSIVGTG